MFKCPNYEVCKGSLIKDDRNLYGYYNCNNCLYYIYFDRGITFDPVNKNLNRLMLKIKSNVGEYQYNFIMDYYGTIHQALKTFTKIINLKAFL
jgi:hypothetical protein